MLGIFEQIEQKSGNMGTERIRRSLHPGDIVWYPRVIPDPYNDKHTMLSYEKSRITGIYPNLVTVVLVNGGAALPVRTITYVDMMLDTRILRR